MTIHRDERGFTFLYPETWHRFTFDGGNGPGVLFSEDPQDLATHVSIEFRGLPAAVTGDDLPQIEKSFLAGLRRVPKSKLVSHTSYDTGFLVGVEAIHTFHEEGQRRKRWVRLLYHEDRQARLVAQAASEAEYERWDVRFRPIMTTFNFGDIWPAP